ncbi:hypothetical protein PoB_004302600 [Plakobranchus ocellatus]|uniref:Uncharacterized protein n=1 Tax=Plakobranchus ocellatus TaxID=259542 RepID=A0AAV4B7V4_9GAST|nr:hypothetical protein PoB_004302600 [Plakobranchus ocellatus]
MRCVGERAQMKLPRYYHQKTLSAKFVLYKHGSVSGGERGNAKDPQTRRFTPVNQWDCSRVRDPLPWRPLQSSPRNFLLL